MSDDNVVCTQELFPELGAGFIEIALETTNYDTEVLTSQLLEDTLAPEISALDRSLATRVGRTIYHGDELDRLTPEAVSKLHRGKRYDAQQSTTPQHMSLTCRYCWYLVIKPRMC
jgi:hypothetical protein